MAEAKTRPTGESVTAFLKRAASGRTGDWPIVAFAPRKQHVTFYLMGGQAKAAPLLKKLGKHKMSGGCLHIKQLPDVDVNVLERMIAASVAQTKKQRA